MGTREGALKAAATRAANKARRAAEAGEPVTGAAAVAGGQTASLLPDNADNTEQAQAEPMVGEVVAGSIQEADDMAKKSGRKAAAAAPKGTKRVAKEKVLSDCKCGCGKPTGGYFVQGHDARFKGHMLKIERGEEKKSALFPAAVIRAYTWVPTRGGGERTTEDYKGVKHSGYDRAK